jgi:hypothetical protein
MLKTSAKLEPGLYHTQFHLPWDTCTQEEALVGDWGVCENGRRQAADQAQSWEPRHHLSPLISWATFSCPDQGCIPSGH